MKVIEDPFKRKYEEMQCCARAIGIRIHLGKKTRDFPLVKFSWQLIKTHRQKTVSSLLSIRKKLIA